MNQTYPRLVREVETLNMMIAIYCRDHHHLNVETCTNCSELRAYAHMRLSKCPYQERKTTCANCPTHCYRRSVREQMRQVMRYAGPRMLWRHPKYTLLHILDGFRKPVPLTQSQKT